MDHKDRRGTLVCNVSDWEGDKQSQSLSILGSSNQAPTISGFSWFQLPFTCVKSRERLLPFKNKETKLQDLKGMREASASQTAANEISTDPAVATVLSGLDCTLTLTNENTAV